MGTNLSRTDRTDLHVMEFPHWFHRSDHTHRVAAAILKHGPIARTTLAQDLGLSQGALSRITSDLIYDGVVEESSTEPDGAAEPRERRGRPQTALRIRQNARTFVGVKINAHLATAVAIDARSIIVSRPHSHAIAEQTPDVLAHTVAELVTACTADLADAHLPTPTAIGIAVGGHIVDDTIVTFAPFLHWEGRIPFAALVEQATGLPTRLYNDIDSLLVDACWFGGGVGYDNFAILTIGTGIGYSLAFHGTPINYPDKTYGLAGHILIDPDGPRCVSGHRGCAQCLTSDSIAEEYSQMIGKAVTFDDFGRDARAGRALATRLVNRTCFRLGTLIAAIANLAMPDKVMIAGESAFIARLGTDAIRDGINNYRHNQSAPVIFEIIDHDWALWAKAAASRVLIRYIKR